MLFSLAAQAEAASLEALVGSEIPRFQCQIYSSSGTLAKVGIARLQEVRSKANKHCLACRGDQCVVKQWPKGQEQGRALCHSLYCIATKYPRAVTSEQTGWADHLAEVRFKINRDGRGQMLEYIARTNADRIKPYKREIDRTTQGLLHSTLFEPLVVDGEPKEIVNLFYLMRIEGMD